MLLPPDARQQSFLVWPVCGQHENASRSASRQYLCLWSSREWSAPCLGALGLDFDVTLIERALELAKGGVCGSIRDIHRELAREHYEAIHEHLSGAATSRQLKQLMRAHSTYQKR